MSCALASDRPASPSCRFAQSGPRAGTPPAPHRARCRVQLGLQGFSLASMACDDGIEEARADTVEELDQTFSKVPKCAPSAHGMKL